MPNELQTVDLGALIQLHDSEFDRQIATAKKWPRSEGVAIERITRMVTSSEDVAAECNYVVPRSKPIQGPSVRLAEICASSWGNSRYASRIIDEGARFVTAQAVYMDLEMNTMVSVEVQRRIENSRGERYDLDMIGVTSQAAMSIAMRNAIFKGIPRYVWGDAYAKARAMVAGSIESLDRRLGAALDLFGQQNIAEEQVLALLGRAHRKDVVPDDLVLLRGVLVAVRDGEASMRTIFGSKEKETRARGGADLGEKLARGREGASQKEGNDEARTVNDSAGNESSTGNQGGRADGGERVGGEDVEDAASGGGDEADPDAPANEADAEVDAPNFASSPKLDAARAAIEAGNLGDWRKSLEALALGLLGAAANKDVSVLWEKMAPKFEAAPEEVDRIHQALRSARTADIRAANRGASKL